MSNKSPLRAALTLLLLLSGYNAAAAQDNLPKAPKFESPVDCAVGADCWIVNYVDVDPTEGALDFTCADRSYDTHKGVDFAVRSMTEVNEGINVRAALTGTVMRVRNGEDDKTKTKEELDSIKEARKECGNAILLDHGPAGFPGLRTMYCHLKNGSINVQPKDIVTTGQNIAQIGHSGLSEFPHLHFGTIWEGGIVDPFTGMNANEGCGKMKTTMWAKDSGISYQSSVIFDAGFENKAPDFIAIQGGAEKPKSISPASDALVFWAALYGMQAGDEVHMEIRSASGDLFVERTTIQEKSRARQYYFTGRRLKNASIRSGAYIGTARLKRKGKKDIVRTEKIIVR